MEYVDEVQHQPFTSSEVQAVMEVLGMYQQAGKSEHHMNENLHFNENDVSIKWKAACTFETERQTKVRVTLLARGRNISFIL